jgi:hypothetical protein
MICWRTKGTLKIRADQHKQFSRAMKIYYHMHRCPVYVKKLLAYEKVHIPSKSTQTFIKGVRDKFFMSHYKIAQKCRSYGDLCDTESYFIRINLPSLNDQIVHKNFTLFWSGPKNFSIAHNYFTKLVNSRFCTLCFRNLQVLKSPISLIMNLRNVAI